MPLLAAQQAPRVWTIQELFTRNVGTTEQQNRQFAPHKIIGNVYYVGTESLSSFLVTTPEGHILINSIYERNSSASRRRARLLHAVVAPAEAKTE